MHNRALCEVCRELNPIELTEHTLVSEIKGTKFSYLATIPTCSKCGEEVYLSEFHDDNIKKMKEAYQTARTKEIKDLIDAITEKYNIGRKPLAKILGWSEATINRYYTGDQYPLKEYLAVLNLVKSDPRQYRDMLEKSKTQITEIAYKKSLSALSDLKIGFPEAEDKIDSVIRYLLFKCEDVTPLALQKLLYYSQSFNKVFNNSFLFPDDCEAWIHGPVYRETYYKYKEYGHNVIDVVKIEDNNFSLSADERELLDYIVKYFGCYSGKILECMTHSEKPWSVTRKDLKPNEYSYDIISKEVIESYFNDVKNKYNLINPSDLKKYSLDLFQQTP